MNILLISQCEKRALKETRRILDQFAERRGERVWQTPITQAGLDTLRKLLRQTARKNTAVACHWIRGKDHSELMWIVGNASRFNAQGAVPTNTTRNDILRGKDENDWHHLEDIRLLTQMAALLHDLGKASKTFQDKLKNSSHQADAFRHEWISLRLFEAFVGATPNDSDWLKRLTDIEEHPDTDWLKRLQRDGEDGTKPVPFDSLPPLARIVGWLMLTHHRLPCNDEIRPGAKTLDRLPIPIKANWCGARGDVDKRQRQACWKFPQGLPFASRTWQRKVAACAKRLLARQASLKDGLQDPYVMHMARLALMLADHHYSSQEAHALGDADFPLYANTDRNNNNKPKQKLDEHLIGVARSACQLLSLLPRLSNQLGHLANHKGFTRRTANPRFRWQDKAFDTTSAIAERTRQQGFFGINMASTGCGKTLANARILYALADAQRGMRATIALGLRTLTLQTGQAYRDRLSLDDDDLAVLVGNAAVRELFNLEQQSASSSGSESSDELLPENNHVHYTGNLEDSVLKDWLGHNSDALRLLQAPLLTCTIDHLMPATESLRGGHQIAPMLRLMTSDLVLDEPDDFDIDDLPALSRLVHWAGLLGSRVLLSSATLPPALIEGLFAAYRQGREVFQRHRGEAPGRQPDIVCAWFDEFHSQSQSCPEHTAFAQAHQQFVTKRLTQLAKSPTRRRAKLVPLSPQPDRICEELARQLPQWMQELHRTNHTEHQGKRVSFGLIRLAHIKPIIEIARTLLEQDAPEGLQIHLCVYHSRHPLLMRSHIERELDTLLKRADNDAESQFQKGPIRRALLQYPQDDHLFVVLASPVAEVGRDHDYDWAIVEPSSMRSLIQLAGRVRRHRTAACDNINIYLLGKNLWSLEGKTEAYCKPGFESKEFHLNSHDLNDLLDPEQLEHLDARSRISEPVPLRAQDRLVDLEHHRLRTLLHRDRGDADDTFSTPLWWETPAWLCGVLQRAQPFRKNDGPETRYVLRPDENEHGKLDFRADNPQDEPSQRWIDRNNLLHEYKLHLGQGIAHWGTGDYLQTLNDEAEQHDLDPQGYARRYGEVRLKESTNGWDYHWALGFQGRK